MCENKIEKLAQLYKALFSIDAGEARPINAWTEEFLPCWNSFKEFNEEMKFAYRENIVVKSKYRDFYELKSCIKLAGEDSNENDWKIEFEDAKKSPLYGCYHSDPVREITYYEHYYTAREEIKHIVRIHERMHAFHHLNSIEGVWSNFKSVSPVYKEFLAQIFTFKCVQNTYLEKHFRALSIRQPFIYQTWKSVKDKTPEEIFALYHKIKTKNLSGIVLLDAYAKAYSIKKANNVINSSECWTKFLVFERTVLEGQRIFRNNPEGQSWNFEIAFKKFETKWIDRGLLDAMDCLW